MTIGLQPASEINGHLAYYDLAVVQEDYAIKRPQDFTLLEVCSIISVYYGLSSLCESFGFMAHLCHYDHGVIIMNRSSVENLKLVIF
jgi:hypothetical protein